MFLYELSIELGLKSGEVAAAAATLDLGPMGPTTKLSPEQVALLRAQAPGIVAASAPPPPPPPVEVPAGHLARELGPPGPLTGAPADAPAPPIADLPYAPIDPRGAPASAVDGPGEPPLSPVVGADAPPAGSAPSLGEPGAITDGGLVPPADPGRRRRLGRGSGRFNPVQVGVVGTAVAAVAVLFGFMVVNTGPDQDRWDEIASAEPISDGKGAAPAGPDGEPLNDQQRRDLAALEAAKAANQEKVCAVLAKIRDVDIAAGNPPPASTYAEVRDYLATTFERSLPIYDEAIVVLPEQADGLRLLKDLNADTAAKTRATSSAAEFDAVARSLASDPRLREAGAAAIELNDYAEANCGFSTGDN